MAVFPDSTAFHPGYRTGYSKKGVTDPAVPHTPSCHAGNNAADIWHPVKS